MVWGPEGVEAVPVSPRRENWSDSRSRSASTGARAGVPGALLCGADGSWYRREPTRERGPVLPPRWYRHRFHSFGSPDQTSSSSFSPNSPGYYYITSKTNQKKKRGIGQGDNHTPDPLSPSPDHTHSTRPRWCQPPPIPKFPPGGRSSAQAAGSVQCRSGTSHKA